MELRSKQPIFTFTANQSRLLLDRTLFTPSSLKLIKEVSVEVLVHLGRLLLRRLRLALAVPALGNGWSGGDNGDWDDLQVRYSRVHSAAGHYNNQ